MLPRLTGKGAEMSRLGGGIGTRGPGETKLETDKRHIRRRMETLQEQLAEVEKHRGQLKRRREKDGVITVAIVGYTNAGKSTLMNYLTDAGVLAQDQLFATLDPTSRALKLPNGVSVMLTDTVGLVRRLPHHLVNAFKSTLEEAAQADIILNVCDASSEEAQVHQMCIRDSRVVAPCSRDDGNSASYFFDAKFNQCKMLLVGKRCGFPGGARHDEGVRPAFQVKFDKPPHLIVINGIILVHRRNKRRRGTFKYDRFHFDFLSCQKNCFSIAGRP